MASSSALRIHLTGSSRDPREDLPYLKKIVETLHECRASIVLNWIDTAYFRSQHTDQHDSIDWHEIVENNLEALSRADAVIIEGTDHGFFQGYQAALALDMRLPVLYVARNAVKNTPMAGIANKLLTVRDYASEGDLESIIKTFVKDNTRSQKAIDINNKAYRFIMNEALLSGKSEAEIIDELVHRRLKA